MGQPPLGDDKPELKFPESLPHSGMEELHDYYLSRGQVIHYYGCTEKYCKEN